MANFTPTASLENFNLQNVNFAKEGGLESKNVRK